MEDTVQGSPSGTTHGHGVSAQRKAPANRKIHWHIFLAHFPVSLFAVCAGFQIIHLFALPTCLEIASNICFAGATVMLVPTTLAGWMTWKRDYRAYRSTLFLRKVTVSYIMLSLTVPSLAWQIAFYHRFAVHMTALYHWSYFTLTILLFGAAVTEGYLGGTLHHR